MAKMTLKVERSTRNPYAQIKGNIVDSLRGMQNLVVQYVQKETPVASGKLVMSEKAEVTVNEKTEMGTLTFSAGNKEAYYGRFVEWGSIHNKPNPFVLRAFRKMRGNIAERIMAAAKKPV